MQSHRGLMLWNYYPQAATERVNYSILSISPGSQTIHSHLLLPVSIFFQKSSYYWIHFIYLFLIDFRERKGDGEKKNQSVVPSIYAFIGWFLYVLWSGMEPSTLAYWDEALTTWTTGSRQIRFIFLFTFNDFTCTFISMKTPCLPSLSLLIRYHGVNVCKTQSLAELGW